MTKVRTWAGLDVHANEVVGCVVDGASGEISVQRLPGETAKVVAFCVGLPGATRVAYEAGPTGFGLARALLAAGMECVVAAPGKIERPAQDRIKTDQRDAERLVRLLMIDGLHPVRVPSDEEEALRDLVRAREDLRGDLMRARHRLSKLLLRHDVRYEDTTSRWGPRHRAWLAKVELGRRGARLTLSDYLGAIEALELRRETLERAIDALIPNSPWAQTIARLRCLRGIDTLSAVGLCVEIGDFDRFEHPRQLMHSLGLVPSENSSGETRRQGQITKTGSRHARRPLVEAAWHYRRAPRLGTTLKRRQHGHTQAVNSDRVEGPAAPASGLAAPGHQAQQAQDDRRRRCRPPARRLHLGDRYPPHASPQHLIDHQPHDTRLRRRRNPPGHHAREHPRLTYEQPPPRPRSPLDSAALTTKQGACGTQPAYISLTTRRAPARPAASSAESTNPNGEDSMASA